MDALPEIERFDIEQMGLIMLPEIEWFDQGESDDEDPTMMSGC